MKLYNLPRGSRIFCECSDGSAYVVFDHVDGMYSYCETEKGAVVHLSAATKLEPVDGGYKIA